MNGQRKNMRLVLRTTNKKRYTRKGFHWKKTKTLKRKCSK